MKKITSFLVMAVLCCVSAFAQETVGEQLPEGKKIKLGTVQAEMVPNQWYFLHQSRLGGGGAGTKVAPGEYLSSEGGLVYDIGTDTLQIKKSATSVIDALLGGQGVGIDTYRKYLVRFVPVEDSEDAYYVQFGTGRYFGLAPANGTVGEVGFKAGKAGKFNFYLIQVNGEVNEQGQFGWNKYNMQERVDNNGAGNTVSLWGSGEVTELGGNNAWQICDVEITGDQDPYEDAISAVYTLGDEMGAQAELIETVQANMGDGYGQYIEEYVEAWLNLDDELTFIMDLNLDNEDEMAQLKEKYPTAEDLLQFIDDYKAAWQAVLNNKVPLAIKGIVPGYYTINSNRNIFTESETYTQEEADALNAEHAGEEGWTTVNAGDAKPGTARQVTKAIKAGSTNLEWATLAEKVEFLWKVEAVEGRPTNYRLINMINNKTFTTVKQSQPVAFDDNDTATVVFDFVDSTLIDGTEDQYRTILAIRSSSQAQGGYNYLHLEGTSATAKRGRIVGWEMGAEATKLYLAPVSDDVAQGLLQSDAIKVRAMMAKADSIVSVVPDQITLAKDSLPSSIVTKSSQFYSQYTINDGQTVPSGKTVYDFLIDGNPNTYWHSDWGPGAVDFKVHYLQISAAEPLNGTYKVKITRRNNANGDHITQMGVVAYNERPTDATTYDDGEELAILTLPFTAKGETVESNESFTVSGQQYLRFYSIETKKVADSNGGEGRGYWHAAEFYVYDPEAEGATKYEKNQYAERQELADAIIAAVDEWNAASFVEAEVDLSNQEFVTAYNKLVAAYEAWAAVYVDPTALRDVIAAAPADDIFVKGNNPGQWPEGAVTPASIVAQAQAYDEGGLYTPAQSQKFIDDILGAEDNIFSLANKVQEGKWYRFSFHTEDTYDNYGWSKTGAGEGTSKGFGLEANVSAEDQYVYTPALFGKYVAAGETEATYISGYRYKEEGTEPDTLTAYENVESEKFYAGHNLVFFDSEDVEMTKGEDLFRFIAVNDSAYMIQNKATGLFVRGGQPATLSPSPTYFSVKAIGTGANLISYTDVFGNTSTTHVNLHGQRDGNKLTCWEADALGSNSMMLITEVEPVAAAPATAYTAKYWPGAVNAITMPVDITLNSDAAATAYGAELTISETDTTVTLKTIKSETISAGTPFILIADLEGEYKSWDDVYDEYKAKSIAAGGNWGYLEKQAASQATNELNVEVEMNHGMKADSLVHGMGNLIGTLKDVDVKAGKHIYADEDGFAIGLNNGTIYAGQAYFECDIDPESMAMLAEIGVKKEGEIEIGITEVLNKVVKSNGNIYNGAGQLVGKGGLGNINRLPAGVYFINGVKIVKE